MAKLKKPVDAPPDETPVDPNHPGGQPSSPQNEPSNPPPQDPGHVDVPGRTGGG